MVLTEWLIKNGNSELQFGKTNACVVFKRTMKEGIEEKVWGNGSVVESKVTVICKLKTKRAEREREREKSCREKGREEKGLFLRS